MKLVIFGLTISSSWGNGHATLWRGLCKALIAHGHEVVFFERDVPYYARHRDMWELRRGRLHLYNHWGAVARLARKELADADVGLVSSYCPDALGAGVLLRRSGVFKVFYDLDTPVTLSRLQAGETVSYVDRTEGLRSYDLVLSYTGGPALKALQTELGARSVAPLYGSVDPELHRPAATQTDYDLSYLGTYAKDRQHSVERLFFEPARRAPQRRFMLGGALYPEGMPWRENISFVQHVAPEAHPGFYCASRLTLNVTRHAMAAMGYCPSGRLFEAAACGVPVVSDRWEGLARFFEPDREILTAESTEEVLEALNSNCLGQIAEAARRRVLAEHTAERRAMELEDLLGN